MTEPTDEPDSKPGSNNDAPPGVTADPGDDNIDETDATTDDTTNATLTDDERTGPTGPATKTDGSEPNTDLVDRPTNDEAAEAAATMVNLRNEGKPVKAESAVRVTRSSTRAAAERTATQERRELCLARRASGGRTDSVGSIRGASRAVGTGMGVFGGGGGGGGLAKPETSMTAAGVVGVLGNLTLGEDVDPSGRRGKSVQSYWPFHCLFQSRGCRPSSAFLSWARILPSFD